MSDPWLGTGSDMLKVKGEKATVKQAERHEVTMQCVQFQMSYAMTHSMLCSITV